MSKHLPSYLQRALLYLCAGLGWGFAIYLAVKPDMSPR